MLTQERKAHILDVLQRDRRVVAKTLSHELGLSEDTIRRDLRDLAAEGLLQRVHGGALPASPALADVAGRWRVSPDAKVQIAQIAARMVQPGQVVILDGGTTAVQMARQLRPDLRATVITHSPSVAVELATHACVEVELIGGHLFKHSIVSLSVPRAAEAIGAECVPTFTSWASPVCMPEMGLTTGDAEEAAIKRALSRQASETVVLASREKLGAVSPFVILPLSEIDALVLEDGLPEELTEPYRAAGVVLIQR